MAFFNDPDGHTLAVMQEAPKGYVAGTGAIPNAVDDDPEPLPPAAQPEYLTEVLQRCGVLIDGCVSDVR